MARPATVVAVGMIVLIVQPFVLPSNLFRYEKRALVGLNLGPIGAALLGGSASGRHVAISEQRRLEGLRQIGGWVPFPHGVGSRAQVSFPLPGRVGGPRW